MVLVFPNVFKPFFGRTRFLSFLKNIVRVDMWKASKKYETCNTQQHSKNGNYVLPKLLRNVTADEATREQSCLHLHQNLQ